MRVTTLRIGEMLAVGDVMIRPTKVHAGKVRLAIDAPPEVTILRGELAWQRRLEEATDADH